MCSRHGSFVIEQGKRRPMRRPTRWPTSRRDRVLNNNGKVNNILKRGIQERVSLFHWADDHWRGGERVGEHISLLRFRFFFVFVQGWFVQETTRNNKKIRSVTEITHSLNCTRHSGWNQTNKQTNNAPLSTASNPVPEETIVAVSLFSVSPLWRTQLKWPVDGGNTSTTPTTRELWRRHG